MILTCPECATGYFVQDGQIKPDGRAVRCAACGHRWTAHPEAPLELVAGAEAGPSVDADAGESSGETGAATLTGDDLPRVFRDRAEEERRMRRAASLGVAWGGALVALVVLAAAAILLRESVVSAWPQTASAYAAIGFEVNPTGLTIEQVTPQAALQDGHATLSITGVIRNVTDHEVVAPPLRISLLNTDGKRVAGQIAVIANATIPAGQARHFLTSVIDPPASTASLDVDFALGMKPPPPSVAHAGAPTGSAPGVALRGPVDSQSAKVVPLTTAPPPVSNTAATE